MRDFDALLPPEIAQKAELLGAERTRLDAVLAVLAGAFIALGARFATTTLAGADGVLPFGVSRLLAGGVFCLGLILVIVEGAELFTGNTLIVMAWAAGKIRLHEMLRVWAIVYFGDFIGAVATALLVFLSGQYLLGDGAVAEVILKLARDKAALPHDQAFFLGILCNVRTWPTPLPPRSRSGRDSADDGSHFRRRLDVRCCEDSEVVGRPAEDGVA